MGNQFTPVSISGYNANPPADDGSATEANRLYWATVKNKLGDPVKTAYDQQSANLVTAFGKIDAGVTSISTGTTLDGTVQGKLIRFTQSGETHVTPDAASVGSPFVFEFLNDSGGDVTLDGNGAQTIDGTAQIIVPDGAGGRLRTDGTNWYTSGRNWSSGLPIGHLHGLTLSNNGSDATNDIDIAVGACRSDDDTDDIRLTVALTKQLDGAWAVGDDAGGLDTGSIANTTYHVWLIKRTDTGVVDVLFSTSASSPTMPSDYDKKRRIGSIVRVAGAIIPFLQDGDLFLWKTLVDNSASFTGVSTTAGNYNITVPVGVRVRAIIQASIGRNAAVTGLRLYCPDLADIAIDVLNTTIGNIQLNAAGVTTVRLGAEVEVLTNTSAQVRAIAIDTTDPDIRTAGYWDVRGRD